MNTYRNYIVIDPAVRFGKPVIKGTRVPVDVVLGKIASGMNTTEIEQEYDLTQEQIRAVLQYAADVVANEDIVLS